MRQRVANTDALLAFIASAAVLRYGSIVLHPAEYDVLQQRWAPAGRHTFRGVRLVSSVFAERGIAVALPPPHPTLLNPEEQS